MKIGITLLLFCGLASAAVMANYKREYYTQSPTGKGLHVCVYEYNGKEYERPQPLGTACATYIMIE